MALAVRRDPFARGEYERACHGQERSGDRPQIVAVKLEQLSASSSIPPAGLFQQESGHQVVWHNGSSWRNPRRIEKARDHTARLALFRLDRSSCQCA